MGGESGPLFNEDPNQPSGGCPETPPPQGSLDQKKQTASKGMEERRAGSKKWKRRSFSLMKHRSVGGVSERQKSERGHREEGTDGRLASGDNTVGHWTSHGCHRSSDWLSDSFNTAAKAFNT